MAPQHRAEWDFVVTDLMEKVFPRRTPRARSQSEPVSVTLGETASFQIAFLPPATRNFGGLGSVRFEVDAAAGSYTRISSVELVPVTLPAFEDHDDGYLSDEPGLYPDLLVPADDGVVAPMIGNWKAAWFDFRVDDAGGAGRHDVTVTAVSTADGSVLFTTTVPIDVLPVRLPELDIVNTHWLHCDGLADYYGIEVFGEDHWHAIDRFVAKAAAMGVNSVLTPVWTPPLDTAVGLTRTPVQLVDIEERDGDYTFGFDKLLRWLRICERHGIRFVELAHLFTQWGARSTPAIYVGTQAGTEQRFGWHVPATDPSYRSLLESLLPALREFLAAHWDEERVIFHISDEPSGPEMLETYQQAKAVVADLLEGCRVIDALSDHEYHASGAVPQPVVAVDAVEPFLDAGVRGFWVYYCVSQNRDVANRFMALPSSRSRVLAHQLFKFEAAGFLHWGFNFYNAHHSTHPIDPYRDTCGGGAFPGGDPFVVYPGPGGEPYESIRFRVLAATFADYRAAQLLRDLSSRQVVLDIVDPAGDLRFDSFTLDPDFYLGARERINREILART